MNKHKEGLADIHRNIRKLLKNRKQGMRCASIRDLYSHRYGKYYSESGFSARLREMKDVKCNLSSFEYSLVKEQIGC